MMHLPPQAYTKETLIQAYNWLRSQPPHVQELAKSPDVLVALYSKAQMHGENYLSRTNLQGFKSELKNLASMMGEFDENQSSSTLNSAPTSGASPKAGGVGKGQSPATAAAGVNSANNYLSPSSVPLSNPPSNSQSHQQSLSPQNMNQMAMNPIAPSIPNGAMTVPPVPNFSSLAVDPQLPLFNAMVNPSMGQDLRSVLDQRSWTMIQEVKNHFNLSSETEAVRLLIAMGYQKMRSQF